MNSTIHLTYKWARRIAIGLLGGSVLLAGLCMVVLPGPAFVVIPLGLAILGLEFAWARHWLRKVREQARRYMPGSKPAATAARGSPPDQTVADDAAVGGLKPAVETQRSSGSSSARNSSYDRTP